MLDEAADFYAESDTLAELLSGLDDADFNSPTRFKNWTFNDIIAHLHLWNYAACKTLADPEQFQDLFNWVMEQFQSGKDHVALQKEWARGKSGRALFEAWKELYKEVSDLFANADADARVQWAGPDMSVRACIVARQMETWAHGQAIFDACGVERADTDRLKNIAHLGVTTYSWTFRNRNETVPLPKPYVNLTAPSGAVWEWNSPQPDNSVHGNAVEFCQVVTQTRNIADTALQTEGAAARRWMEIAQCFAGAPNEPPAKGSRFCAV